ncbi:COG3904 family protein [Parasedimentitalea psychrophila]|uniref:Clp protease n=1 Tax=Parasedimentitalea psychrophila TaxID=2997337 RepID=A0A9Y2KWS3_9RHOB|nr:hypothetical protein [Parasedimentitalea psychrophila]WIY23978.1 hypothetical protein QPJ95_15275 [Parasedimentitalea psychrophila]
MIRRAPLALPHSFWLHLVLPRAVILLALSAADGVLRLDMRLLYGLVAADALVFLWQVMRFQASADNHLRGMGGMTLIWGGYLVLLVSGFASISLWWGSFLFAAQPETTELFTDRMDRLHAAEYQLSLSDDGSSLSFSGTITYGLTKRATELLAANPQLVTVTLTSIGGHIYEARGFANLIRARGLNTVVKGDCSSACTLLFVAGTQRRLAPGARLGFHRYALEFGPLLPNLDLAKEQEKDLAFFRAQGISEAFLAQVFEQPSSALWYPSRQQALQAGLLVH